MRVQPFRSLFAAFAIAIACASSPAATAAEPQPVPLPAAQAASVAQKVQAFYDQSTNFQSDFVQDYFIKQYNKRKVSHGHVVFDKPGKMNWSYVDPQGNWVKSDGKLLCVYNAADNQMYQQDVTASQYPAALAFLTGQGQLASIFNFSLFDGGQAPWSFPGGWVLVGTPVSPTPAYQKVLFYVDKATSQVRRVLVVDGQGNHNRFDFEAPIVNTKSLDQNQFTCRVPAGATVTHP